MAATIEELSVSINSVSDSAAEMRRHAESSREEAAQGHHAIDAVSHELDAVGHVVGEISQALNSGRHTTTTSLWYWLDEARSAAVIDSPGFQEFGLHHIAPTDLARLMPDLSPHVGECRFHNCTHRQEPGCAIRAAVERGEATSLRWHLYTDLYEELSQPRW